MPQRISIRRIAYLVVAVALLGGAIYCGIEAWRLDREFRAWTTARPVVTSVDFSKPGRSSAPFHQTCCASHGEAIFVTVPPSTLIGCDRSTLLDGLHGMITITDGDEKEIESLEISNEPPLNLDHEEQLMLAYFRPFENGHYIMTIDVDSGAPGLVGKQQTVHAEYLLCGLERFPSMINGLFALIMGVPALIMLAKVTFALSRHGWSQPDDAS